MGLFYGGGRVTGDWKVYGRRDVCGGFGRRWATCCPRNGTHMNGRRKIIDRRTDRRGY